MIRLLAFVGGLAGAAAMSQFPEFSQQYLQRLAGQVDALGQVAADFDASADKAGLSREEALASMSGTEFLGYRQEDMRRAFTRLQRLASDLTLLRETGPVERVLLPHRFADRELLEATWGDFRPAVPVTTAGFTTAGAGFVGGWLVVMGLLSFVLAPLSRRSPR